METIKHHLAQETLARLRKAYTKKKDDYILWKNPLELVIGTVLSAQCTDKKVNAVTQKILFPKYKTATDYAAADLDILEHEIFSIGFYRTKARYLKGIGVILLAEFDGHVPERLEDLLKLPGVSYKTAYLVLAKAFGKYEGIAVDTHVKRIAPRIGLTDKKTPQKISADLMNLYTPSDYLDVNEFMILHGRALCKSVPQCERCVLRDICATGSS